MAKETEKEKNAIVAAGMRLNGAGLVLRSATDLKLASELFKNAGLAPNWCDTPAKAAFVIEAGQEIGLKPVQALNSFQLINGQLGIKAQTVAGLIRGSGKALYLTDDFEGQPGSENYKAIVKSKRKDDPKEKQTDFSIGDAVKAGLVTKDNWKHYPQDMLWCRAMARHGRRYYSDVLCGFYTTEELSEITPPAAVPTPEVPGREERKQVDAVVKDTPQMIKQLADEVGDLFKAKLEELKGTKYTVAEVADCLAQLAGFWFGGDVGTWKAGALYTINNLTEIKSRLEAEGLPAEIADMARGSQAEEAVAAEKRAEEKFGMPEDDFNEASQDEDGQMTLPGAE